MSEAKARELLTRCVEALVDEMHNGTAYGCPRCEAINAARAYLAAVPAPAEPIVEPTLKTVTVEGTRYYIPTEVAAPAAEPPGNVMATDNNMAGNTNATPVYELCAQICDEMSDRGPPEMAFAAAHCAAAIREAAPAAEPVAQPKRPHDDKCVRCGTMMSVTTRRYWACDCNWTQHAMDEPVAQQPPPPLDTPHDVLAIIEREVAREMEETAARLRGAQQPPPSGRTMGQRWPLGSTPDANTRGETGNCADQCRKPSEGGPAGPSNKDAQAECDRKPSLSPPDAAPQPEAPTLADDLARDLRLLPIYRMLAREIAVWTERAAARIESDDQIIKSLRAEIARLRGGNAQ